jgi:DNA-binding CsgD family transcriptional regulator
MRNKVVPIEIKVGPKEDTEASSVFVLEKSSLRILFVIKRNDGESHGNLFDRMAFLIASHCVVHNREFEELRILMEFPTSEDMSSKVKSLCVDIVKAHSFGSVRLSNREREVLNFVCLRLCNKDIASRMNVSERTVKFHVTSLLRKYGVDNRVDLANKIDLMGG